MLQRAPHLRSRDLVETQCAQRLEVEPIGSGAAPQQRHTHRAEFRGYPRHPQGGRPT